jgi:hypothetical protein
MAMLDAVGSLMKGKLSAADKKKMEEKMKREGNAAMKAAKPGDLGKNVTGAASPFSYLLNMAKKKKAQ